MFLVYVHCLERNAKTAKSLPLPGRLPEIGALFCSPSSLVIYPTESYILFYTPPLLLPLQHCVFQGCRLLFTSLRTSKKESHINTNLEVGRLPLCSTNNFPFTFKVQVYYFWISYCRKKKQKKTIQHQFVQLFVHFKSD